jgi:Ca2+-binding EF-hand superfamily protein
MKHKTNLVILLSILMTTAFVGTAIAKPPPARPGPAVAKTGIYTRIGIAPMFKILFELRAQLRAHKKQIRTHYDANGDGKLSKLERKQLNNDRLATKRAMGIPTAGIGHKNKKARKAELLAKFDANHDGKLTGVEKRKARGHVTLKRGIKFNKLLTKFDTNGDKLLSKAELRRKAVKGKRNGQKNAHKGKRKGKHQRVAKLFKKLDKNHDGQISKREFVTANRHKKGKNKRNRKRAL